MKNEQPTFGTYFTCSTCGTDETRGLSREDFFEHLKAAHLMHSPIQGERQMIFHADFQDRYISSYIWNLGRIEAIEETVGPRGAAARKG